MRKNKYMYCPSEILEIPQGYIFVGTLLDTRYRLCQVHLKLWKFLRHVEIYKMKNEFKTYQWMQCKILASYIHSHHHHLDISSCLS